MKKIQLAILFLAVSILGYSQVTDTGDKVGVGESNPSNKLHVKFQSGDLNFDQAIRIQTNLGLGNVGRGGGIIMQNHDVITGGIFAIREMNNWTGSLLFYTHSNISGNSFGNSFTEKMRLNSSGNLGIGTPNPQTKIDIQGDGEDIRISRVLGWNTSDDKIGGIYFNVRNSWDLSDRNGARIESYSDVHNDRQDLRFFTNYGGVNERMRITGDGKVGIGTTDFSGNHKLRVEGSIGAREIKVEASGWSDFVFENDYELRTLEEVEEHINENGHLPEIPSEAEVTENGINLGEMNAKLLQKIEELTLYLIEQNKQNQAQQALIEQLQKEVSALKNE